MRTIANLIEFYSDSLGISMPVRKVAPREDLLGRGATPPVLGLENYSALELLTARIHAISFGIVQTCFKHPKELEDASDLMASWMQKHQVVRILGAGRALLAGSMPGNRLAHGGAQVSFVGGMAPLPNSDKGGGVIACSGSGKTAVVLEAMRIAKEHNSEIKVIGLAWHEAESFAKLCDVFIGIHAPKNEYPNPLSALADTEEYIISEILDGLVVMAGRKIDFDDNAWRKGHEDIGPTGPYAAV